MEPNYIGKGKGKWKPVPEKPRHCDEPAEDKAHHASDDSDGTNHSDNDGQYSHSKQPATAGVSKKRKSFFGGPQFAPVLNIQEQKRTLYWVEFCTAAPEYANYFVSVGGCKATVYENIPASAGVKPTVIMRQCYIDADSGVPEDQPEGKKAPPPVKGAAAGTAVPPVVKDSESWFGAAWTLHPDRRTPLLALGGHRGIVKIMDCTQHELFDALVGHGAAINQLRFHPIDGNLLMTCSEDQSLRLWNIKTHTLVAIFAGHGGHQEQVLSLSWYCMGTAFASSGMDHHVKIWDMETADVKSAIKLSYTQPRPAGRPFKTAMEQFPLFTTDKLHNAYVDCVLWVGNLLLTKATDEAILLWKPDPDRDKDAVLVLRKFELDPAALWDIWFVRFTINREGTLLATADKWGQVHIWDLSGQGVGKRKYSTSSNKVWHYGRSLDFSPDGKTLLVARDDGVVARLDLVKSKPAKKARP